MIKNAYILFSSIWNISLIMLFSGSSLRSGITENATYLSPIPEVTLLAYREGQSIENKLQAVVAANAALRTTRIHYDEQPKAIQVELMKLKDAHNLVRYQGTSDYAFEDRPDNTRVWLVLFKRNFVIIPPDPENTYTPVSPTYGCLYVILDNNNPGRTEVSGLGCP